MIIMILDTFNPRCACAARITVVVLSVGVYSPTTGNEAADEELQRL